MKGVRAANSREGTWSVLAVLSDFRLVAMESAPAILYRGMKGLLGGTLFCLAAILLSAQDLRDYERKVSEFTLSNGLHFIVFERHQLPTVSFDTYVNAGSANDPAGQTGLAHLMERLAFKGTDTIGSRNWPAEKKAIEDLDAGYDHLQQEFDRGRQSDAGRIAALQAQISLLDGAAHEQETPGELLRILQENGVVNTNCHVTPDSIETTYSLPSNRIELWFLLESQRLQHPVFREFYRERANLATDIANTVESRPVAKLQQSLLANAFEAIPYRNPVLGWPSDVATLRRPDALAFFNTYFVPGNMAIAIVGDVDPSNARQLAERYFGPIPAKPLPPAPHTQEPVQLGPKTVALWGNLQPRLLIAYKRPGEASRDDMAFDAIRMILGEGRSGWLYKDLVDGKRIAQDANVIASFPSGRYLNLFVVSVTPAADRTVEENQKAVDDVLARFGSKPVDAETLTRVKNIIRWRATQILGSNREMAALLPSYYFDFGDCRRLFTATGEFDRLTAEDIQRVALQYFQPGNRTVAFISPPPAAGAHAAGVAQ